MPSLSDAIDCSSSELLLGCASFNFGARTNLTIARSRLRRMIMSHPRLDVVVSWGAVNGNMIQRFLFRPC